MDRRLLAVCTVLCLLGLAGCLGAPSASDEALSRNASYDWSRNAAVTYNVTGSEFQAVVQIESDEPVAVYRHGELGDSQALGVSAVKFRYPNGTVVSAPGNVTVETSRERTLISPPAANGTLAYTARTLPKEFRIAVDRSGSHRVVLPAGTGISVPVLGSVSPGGAEHAVEDGRVHLTWANLDGGSIELHYYLQRDLYIYGGLVAVALLAGAAGVVYFRVKIRQLERRREESGLGVEDP